MRLGGSVLAPYDKPEGWLEEVKRLGYGCVIAPFDHTTDKNLIRAYMNLMEKEGLILGEVGAWSNPMATNEETRRKNISYCQGQLALAEEVGAKCCVNIVGGTGEIWDGFYEENYDSHVYSLIVDRIREIIDGVKPSRTFYTIEPMPWMVPDSPEAYLQLLKDVDRKGFAVHLDYTNMINQPIRYIKSRDFIKHCFKLLGPYTKSVHIKDVAMSKDLPVSIKEVIPGEGGLDMGLVMELIHSLSPTMTAFVEHFSSDLEYVKATNNLKAVAVNRGIPLF